jgi:hypothetical protein
MDKKNNDIVLMLTGWNEINKHLDEIPHRKILDITVCYLTAKERHENGEITGFDMETLVRDEAEKRGLSDEEELYSLALKNTKRMFPVCVHAVTDGMICITNSGHTFGAAAMIYDNELAEAAKIMDSDMYIVPSSIHEVLCIDPNEIDPADIYEYIQYSNRECLAPKDVLSGSLYYYDRERRRLTIAYSDKSPLSSWVKL